MFKKIKLTKIQFILIVGVVLLVILAVLGRFEFLQIGGMLLVIAVFLAIGGAIPFFIGVILQAVFRKKVIPSSVPWTVAVLIVFVPWLFRGGTLRKLLEIDIFNLGLSVLIIGVFMEAGIKSVRAFREGRQSAKKASS